MRQLIIDLFSSPLVARSTALEASHVVKAAPGKVVGITGHNNKSSGQYIQIHNTTSLPADTAVPAEVFYVPANSSFSWEAAGTSGDVYTTGIVICNSSTLATKTIGSADCLFFVRYR